MKYGLVREVVLVVFLIISIIAGVWLLLYDSADYLVLGFVVLASAFVVTIAGFFLFKLHDKHRLAQLKSKVVLTDFNVSQFEKELIEYPDLKKHLQDNNFQVLNYIDNGLWGSFRYFLLIDNKRENIAVYKANSAFFSIPVKSVFLHCYRNATIGDYSQKTQQDYYEKKKIVEKATTVTNIVGAAP